MSQVKNIKIEWLEAEDREKIHWDLFILGDRMYVCIHRCVCVWICVCMYIYTHTHTHTLRHTQWHWGRLSRVPWMARRANQSILKEINLEYSLAGLKLQYFGHLMQRADSLEKTLMLGKSEGKRRRGWQRIEMVRQHHRCNGHEF